MKRMTIKHYKKRVTKPSRLVGVERLAARICLTADFAFVDGVIDDFADPWLADDFAYFSNEVVDVSFDLDDFPLAALPDFELPWVAGHPEVFVEHDFYFSDAGALSFPPIFDAPFIEVGDDSVFVPQHVGEFVGDFTADGWIEVVNEPHVYGNELALGELPATAFDEFDDFSQVLPLEHHYGFVANTFPFFTEESVEASGVTLSSFGFRPADAATDPILADLIEQHDAAFFAESFLVPAFDVSAESFQALPWQAIEFEKSFADTPFFVGAAQAQEITTVQSADVASAEVVADGGRIPAFISFAAHGITRPAPSDFTMDLAVHVDQNTTATPAIVHDRIRSNLKFRADEANRISERLEVLAGSLVELTVIAPSQTIPSLPNPRPMETHPGPVEVNQALGSVEVWPDSAVPKNRPRTFHIETVIGSPIQRFDAVADFNLLADWRDEKSTDVQAAGVLALPHRIAWVVANVSLVGAVVYVAYNRRWREQNLPSSDAICAYPVHLQETIRSIVVVDWYGQGVTDFSLFNASSISGRGDNSTARSKHSMALAR